MRIVLTVLAMALLVGGCSSGGDVASHKQTTEAHHAACRKAEFDHAAMRICAASDSYHFFCLYCVDQRGVMFPFEDKTE